MTLNSILHKNGVRDSTKNASQKTSTISVHSKDTIALISNLGTMLTAGIPLQEAVESLLADSKANVRKVLVSFNESLKEGRPISSAMAQFPRVFDNVTISLIKASEESGTLDIALKDLSQKLKKEKEFHDEIVSNLTYPAFVIVIFFLVLGLMLTFVIPRISGIFAGLRIELPLATQVLIAVSNAFTSYAVFILGGLGLLGIALAFAYRSYKKALFNGFLTIPGLRTLGVNIDLARFTRSMSLLLASGIPIADALVLSKASVTTKSMSSAVEDMHVGVLEGKPLSAGLRDRSNIPTIMVKMTETAEKSGTLEPMMQEMADHFEARVSRSFKTITTLIEPLMIVVIGVMVGGMMLAVIAPMYNMITQIKTR